MDGQFNCYTVMFISSFRHVRLSLDNKRLLTYLVLTYLARFRMAVCLSQFFSRCLFKHFKLRSLGKNDPYDSIVCYLVC